MALNGGGLVSHEHELGGDQSCRRVPAQSKPTASTTNSVGILIFTRDCPDYGIVVAVVDSAFVQVQR
jgi:hypothetical protein